MIIDAGTIPRDTSLSTDVCVVGAGAAGISLARELSERGFDCIITEGGDLRPGRRSQYLYEGDCIGTPYDLVGTRTRYFGGSTNCWGAFCAPIDDWYFEMRDWVPSSGWPIAASDISHYYSQAATVLGIDPRGFDTDYWQTRLGDSSAKAARLDTDYAFISVAQRAVERARFGRFFRPELSRSEKATVLINATVAYLQVSYGGQEVERVRVLSDAGAGFWIKARLFILAAGGIENPRLLLLSNGFLPGGIGNQHDVVGRYFMEHPLIASAIFDFADKRCDARQYDTLYTYLRNRPAMLFHRLSRDVEERKQALYSISSIEPVFSRHNLAVDALKHFHRFIRTLRVPDNFSRHLSNLVKESKGVAALARYILFGTNAGISRWQLTTAIETCPNPESRIILTRDKDRLGMNRVRLNWQLTELDRHTMKTVVETLAVEFSKTGLATVRPHPTTLNGEWADNPSWINHHMGTTRMGNDPTTSVVDANCRVHGVSNLYIAGSSVFPSAPTHSPTFTIVALALRLVDHIAQTAQRR